MTDHGTGAAPVATKPNPTLSSTPFSVKATDCPTCTEYTSNSSTEGSFVTKSSDKNNFALPSNEVNMITTVVTVTSCENNACSQVPITTGLTVVTKDETTYTTYCPLTKDVTSVSESRHIATSAHEGGDVPETDTAVITVVSCDGTSCSYVPKTTGVSYDYNDQTTHTTYYPLSNEINLIPSSQAPEFAPPVVSNSPSYATRSEAPDTPQGPSNTNVVSQSGSTAPQTVAPAIVSNSISPSSSSSTFGSSFTSPAVLEGSAHMIKPWTLFSLVALAAIFYF